MVDDVVDFHKDLAAIMSRLHIEFTRALQGLVEKERSNDSAKIIKFIRPDSE